MAFFRKGEELEATGFETLPYDDPTLMPPKLGFSGFDKIPRKRAPLVIALVLIAVAALSVFVWLRSADVATSVRDKASGEWVRLKTFVAKQSTPSSPR
jgi:hypothetical protein